MIIRPKLNWLRMLFVWRGSVVIRILPQLTILVVSSGLVVALSHFFPDTLHDLTPVPFTLLGIALAIFLSFRNSVSYDRFWEGRKLWGSILNDTRALARQHRMLTDADIDSRRQFVYTLIAFVQATKAQLREATLSTEVVTLIRKPAQRLIEQARFKPVLILADAAEQLRELRQAGKVCPISLVALDKQLSLLNEDLGGCERLASTPVPFAYSVILHRTVYLYSFLLPFGLVNTLGLMTPLIVAFVSYTFLSIEALAEELQEPFGLEPNDLALDAMSSTIEATLREMLGETDLPQVPEPVNCVLN
jgi:putative membrane protein